ncbi:adhesion G protein-coupled receptor E4-like [Photinus pyralis]|uniref:adhesion G protein-coupled receptor E4-like n=1 Tax=Photinus pyralis TaxID=7054 RepID=UPI0012672EBC|nr:adhesion G protein-coupled receptor E4-like [Photinus pyralis]
MNAFRALFLFACALISHSSTQKASSSPPLAVVPLQTDENSADIETSSTAPFLPITLLPFTQLAHGLRSGPITIIDPRTFFIQDLHYDGKGPDAHFWVGKGTWPSGDGILVRNENQSSLPLPAYTGQNVTITLPGSLTYNKIDYLAMWCITFKHNFGHTFIRRRPSTEYGVQLAPFTRLAHGLRSGPIVAVDKKTFFVSNLHYDGKGPDAHFWAGKGPEPSTDGVLVPDENGSSKSLSEYTGQNVYVTLPGELTTDSIDYFGLWCIQFKQNFGHTTIPKNVTIPEPNGNPLYTHDNRRIIRVQKCCALNQVLLEGGCGSSEERFNPPMNVHEHNSSHIDDEPIAAESIEFVPFVQAITCSHQKYPLDPEEESFPLMKNGSLMVLNTQNILSMDNYCIETVNLGDEAGSRWVTTAILCFSSGNVPLSSTFFVIYAVGIILSAAALILTALVFLVVKEVRDARGKCIVFYSSSMAVAFICLVSAQFSGIDKTRCRVIAFIVQFFLVSSFTWLTMVSIETYCKIVLHNKEAYTQDGKRLRIYLGVGLLVPLLTLIISLLIDLIPDIPTTVLKPHFGRNSCWFDDSKESLPYFYAPVGIAILVNLMVAILSKITLLHFQKTLRADVNWKTLEGELKPMYRSCVFLLILMTLCWVTEIISSVLQSTEGFWTAIDIINSLQGVIVFIIFVAHRPVSNKLCKKRRKREDAEETQFPLQGRQESLLANGHRETNQDFLTTLHRVDSTELE